MKYIWTEEHRFEDVAVRPEQDQLDGRDQEEANARAEEEEQDDEVFPLPTNIHQVPALRTLVIKAKFVSSSEKVSNYVFIKSWSSNRKALTKLYDKAFHFEIQNFFG